MNEDFLAAMAAIEKEKGVKKEILFDAIEAALVSAYKRNFNTAANVRVQLNRDSGEIKVFTRLVVVAEVFQAQLEISLAEVREIDLNYQLGDIVEKEVTPKNFGRIAAQTAKQVVIQRIREAEREMVFDEYIDREEDIITGIVQRIEQKNVIIDLGKAEAVLSPTEQMPSDEYKQGERVKAYINEVRKTTKGPQIFISRTHPGLLKRLFELEVPEIFDGTVEIKAVAREAGFRSKLAVYSKNRDVDPVGACVGPKGARVQAIVDELRGEKIDIVKWDENPEIFVANALSPAKVVVVMLQSAQKVANVIVPDYQLSLAIGKEGQNARLAAKLTNWKIDIASESQAAERVSSSLEASGRLSRRERELEEPEISGGSSQRKALVGTTLAKGVADDETP
ncbi:MAG: transcription termination/antitermination protein NusA [Dethiobacter sp.]|jgi:N utilization substance protein A|nr:transcription termination/antitermination protein NusA [Dethiobacter sp.]MBS3897929.1 transcription termination/antitermination protein NusA [Dethiobacter sp.]